MNKAVQNNLVAAALVRQHFVEALPALLVQLSYAGLHLLQGLNKGREGGAYRGERERDGRWSGLGIGAVQTYTLMREATNALFVQLGKLLPCPLDILKRRRQCVCGRGGCVTVGGGPNLSSYSER